MQRPARDESTSNQEYRLLDYLERLGRYREGRKAVHIHLSSLKSHTRRDQHLRIAGNSFESLVSSYDGQLFRLSNHDIVFIFKEADPLEVDEAVTRLRYMFNDDPLGGEVAPEAIEEFSDWYDVDRQYDELRSVMRSLYEDVQKRSKRLSMIAGIGNEEDKPPITPHRLGELVDTISSADLSNLMRRQVIFAILSNQPPQPLFRELFISIPELRKLILPNYNISSNRWLFQYLTETLDRRMLSMLVKNDDPAIANSFSLNINVATILSPEFMAFDASLKAGARGTIVLELQMIDIYADLGSFTFARDFVHDRGYRICLDGLNELSIPFVDRAKLGIDLVKLEWAATLLDDRGDDLRQRLRETVETMGKAKVIMSRVDSEDGLKYGQSIGIAMYQGRFIDQMVAPRSPMNRPR